MTRADMAMGLGVLAALAAVTYQRLYETPPMTPVTVKHEPQAPAKIDKSPKKQAQRQKLIAHLIDLGVFQKVETVSPTTVHVYVMPGAFNSLRFEIKQSYMSAVFTARFDDMAADKAVHVIDATNRKRLAHYSPAFGGLSLE
jgi:hypothetical protein